MGRRVIEDKIIFHAKPLRRQAKTVASVQERPYSTQIVLISTNIEMICADMADNLRLSYQIITIGVLLI